MATATVPPTVSTNPAPAHDRALAALPTELTRFVGRAREIAAVRELLGTTRLLTLTGAGGSGKTRLAREVAAQAAAEYADGAAWVELAALSAPELIPRQIATALALREAGGASALELVQESLRERQLLLVLDNCEHLVDACAGLAEILLRGAPGLRILATSREALGVVGERAWLTPGLSLPEARLSHPEAVGRAEAVQLFVERAQDMLPSFRLTEANAAHVAQICRRLDGIPLAIELAAARVRVLTPEQIAERLGDAFRLLTGGRRTSVPRQQTLRAAMEWSYRLLSEREQALLQRLSVFVGGFGIEAAEAVCADENIESYEVLDLISALVDKSLLTMQVRSGEARYGLLETVRQFAIEQLHEAGGEETFRRRHAEFFLRFAEAQERPPGSAALVDAMARLEDEHDNLRAVLRWSLDRSEVEIALRMVGAVRGLWQMHGHLHEGRQWCSEVLAAEGPHLPRVRALALFCAGSLAILQADWASAEQHFDECLALGRAAADRRLVGRTLVRLSVIATEQGERERAGRLLEEGWSAVEAAGDRAWMPDVLISRGRLAYTQGDYGEAAAFFQQGASVSLKQGLISSAAILLSNLGRALYMQGDFVRAEASFRESLLNARYFVQPYNLTYTLASCACVAASQGRYDRAARLFGAVEALFAATGGHLYQFDRPMYDAALQAVRSALNEAEWEPAWRDGEAMTLAQAIEYALAPDPHAPSIAEPAAPPPAPAPDPAPDAEPAVTSTVAVQNLTPAPLRVRALGPLEIYREGEALGAGAWAYARPRELLLYLLSHPKGRTREQIGLVFWPDASAAQVKNSFHVMLHHLRKALGRSDFIVFDEDRYRINPALDVEFDAARFEQQITEALRELRTGGTITPERLASVLGLYRGDFLEEETAGDWHLETRDHLSRLYREGMLALGELLVQAERWAEAAEVYQRVVRREDLHEEAHRRLMRCWAEAGERMRALRHYEGLVSLLQAELDAEPEDETTELYERLKRAEPV